MFVLIGHECGISCRVDCQVVKICAEGLRWICHPDAQILVEFGNLVPISRVVNLFQDGPHITVFGAGGYIKKVVVETDVLPGDVSGGSVTDGTLLAL